MEKQECLRENIEQQLKTDCFSGNIRTKYITTMHVIERKNYRISQSMNKLNNIVAHIQSRTV